MGRRIGIACFGISIGLALLAFFVSGDASIRYAIYVAAHALLYTGFLLVSIVHFRKSRKVGWEWVALTLSLWLVYIILGPIAMSAAAAGRPM